jgi:hypothetical protein
MDMNEIFLKSPNVLQSPTELYGLLSGGGGFLEGSFLPAFTASLLTLPSPKVTVEGIGVKGVAEAAEADPLAKKATT